MPTSPVTPQSARALRAGLPSLEVERQGELRDDTSDIFHARFRDAYRHPVCTSGCPRAWSLGRTCLVLKRLCWCSVDHERADASSGRSRCDGAGTGTSCDDIPWVERDRRRAIVHASGGADHRSAPVRRIDADWLQALAIAAALAGESDIAFWAGSRCIQSVRRCGRGSAPGAPLTAANVPQRSSPPWIVVSWLSEVRK